MVMDIRKKLTSKDPFCVYARDLKIYDTYSNKYKSSFEQQSTLSKSKLLLNLPIVSLLSGTLLFSKYVATICKQIEGAEEETFFGSVWQHQL